MKQATVAIEDRRFYQHGALDYQGILRAGIKDIFGNGGSLQGASTLTMQLVDNRYLDGTKYAAQPRPQVQDHPGQARRAARQEAPRPRREELDPRSVPERRPVRHRRRPDRDRASAPARRCSSTSPCGSSTWRRRRCSPGSRSRPRNSTRSCAPSLARRAATRCCRRWSARATSPRRRRAPPSASRCRSTPTAAYQLHRQPYMFDYVEQQLIKQVRAEDRRGRRPEGLHDDRPEPPSRRRRPRSTATRAARCSTTSPPRRSPRSTRPPATSSALASSATYDQTKYFYPVQAQRQTGSAFKVFALMTLIHDYDGDPSQTYYTSKFLPAGWEPADPTWSVHTAEETYQGDDQRREGDDGLRQHRVRPAGRRPGLGQARSDSPRDGDHLAARRQPLRGDRRSDGLLHDARDGRRVRDARQRRLPHRPDDLEQGRVPRRQLAQPRRPAARRRCSRAARRTPPRRCSRP